MKRAVEQERNEVQLKVKTLKLWADDKERKYYRMREIRNPYGRTEQRKKGCKIDECMKEYQNKNKERRKLRKGRMKTEIVHWKNKVKVEGWDGENLQGEGKNRRMKSEWINKLREKMKRCGDGMLSKITIAEWEKEEM